MTSKEILEKICRYANKQCEIFNVNVDFMKDFILHYIPGDWQYAIDDSKNFIRCTKNEYTLNLGVNVPWHLEAYDRYINNIHLFSPEVPLSDKAYDVILNGMLTGCDITLNSRNANEINKQIEQLKNKFSEAAKNLILTKKSNLNYMVEAQTLMDEFNNRTYELSKKAHPIITLVPNNVTTIEQFLIWLDLNTET